jgi:Kelch motif.
MAIGRENPGVCYSYNKIYICGGTGIESFEVFNPTTNKFSLLVLRLPSPGKCCLFPYDDIIYILQKNKIYKVEIPKIAFSIVNDVENKEWWSPCESQATTNGIFFCFEENFYKLSVDDHSITLINFIPN